MADVCLHPLTKIEVHFGHEPAGTSARCGVCRETLVTMADRVIEFLLGHTRRLAGLVDHRPQLDKIGDWRKHVDACNECMNYAFKDIGQRCAVGAPLAEAAGVP